MEKRLRLLYTAGLLFPVSLLIVVAIGLRHGGEIVRREIGALPPS